MTAEEREKRILQNLGLVRHLVKKYKLNGNAISREDLVREGIIGLIEAVDSQDDTKGPFIKRAMSFITYKIIRAIRIHDGNFSVGPRMFKLLQLCQSFILEHNKEPSYEEFNKIIDSIGGISYKNALAVYEGYSNGHKEHDIFDDGMKSEKLDNIAALTDINNEDVYTDNYRKDVIYRLLDKLKTREMKILCRYYGIKEERNKNLREIAQEMQLSISTVGDIKRRAELKMKALLCSHIGRMVMGKFDYNQWYQENKNKLSWKRKLKYRLNKPFRDQMKKYSKKYYQANIQKRVPRSVMIIDGKKYLTIGGLARVIQRTEQTIREYHKDGIIPETKRGNNRGWRVYSIPHAKAIKEAFVLFGEEKLASLREVKKYIHERW